MPRLIALLFLFVVGVLAVTTWLASQAARATGNRYRPQGKSRRRPGAEVPRSADVDAATLAQLRDALTGAPLDAREELFRCADCESYYSATSVRALAHDNAARCVSCGSTRRIPVNVAAAAH